MFLEALLHNQALSQSDDINLHTNFVQRLFVSPFGRWGCWGSERWSLHCIEPLLSLSRAHALSSNSNHSYEHWLSAEYMPSTVWRLHNPPRNTALLRPSLRPTFTKRRRCEIALLLWASWVPIKYYKCQPPHLSFPWKCFWNKLLSAGKRFDS